LEKALRGGLLFCGALFTFRHICGSATIDDNRSVLRHFGEPKKSFGSWVSPDIGDKKVNYQAGSSHFVANLET
jgi:hypothetical protein